MSNINIADIKYPYIKIKLSNNNSSKQIGVNLSRLYVYIDEHINMGRIYPYGNAYKIIKEKANRLMGRNDIKISKHQVASLIKYYTFLGTIKYIKIPYLSYYIFKAVFEIVDNLRVDYPLPDDLDSFVGEVRRDIFYCDQSELFNDWYHENRNEKTRGLHDDIFAGNSVLSKKF